MSLEIETMRPSGCGSVKLDEALKKPRRSYTREFLLSLSGLDVCKKLPSDFDESLLGELGEGVQSLQDRSRVSGSHHFQVFRRNDHGSSPPRWDSANFTAGNYGKTGNHSSMQSDQDSGSQFDRDSESGKHRWQSRRSWHAPEHDGLLGSGSSSRLGTGISAPKNKTNDNYPLKKSHEIYQPPRPFKAVPHSKKDIDSNDETFGSSDFISEDRAEGERRRRASFEQMRKQQQKALQGKLTHNVDDASDIFVQHDNKKGDTESSVHKDQVLDVDHIWKNPPGKCAEVLSSPAYRPLVPPGFRNSLLEKNPESKSNLQHASFEGGISMKEDVLGSETSFQYGTTSLERSADKKSDVERQLPHASSGFLEDPGVLNLSSHVLSDKAVANSNTGLSNSLLERMFWGPASTDGHGVRSGSQSDVCKPDDARNAGPVLSSKFAQAFFEADAISSDDLSGRPADILSLIVSGDKNRYQASGSETSEHFSDDIFLNNAVQSKKFSSTSSPADSMPTEKASVLSKEKSFPTILTCADLENSILTEYSAHTTSNMPPSNPWSGYPDVEPSSKHVDDNASLHLLSLLQRNSNQSKDEEISIANISLSEPSAPQSTVAVISETKVNDKSSVAENKLTLEMLFGSAFMKELQSAEAPLSIQRGLSGSAEVQAADAHGIPSPYTDTRVLSAVDPINFQRSRSDQMLHSFNQQKQVESRSAENLWGYTDPKLETSFSPRKLDGSIEFQIPSGSVISSNGPHGYQMLAEMSTSNNNGHFSRDALLEHVDRHLTTTGVNEGSNVLGSDMAPKYRPYENMEPELPYPLQHSSPQLQHLQMAQVWPLHGSVEPTRTSQVEVLGSETFYNHDALASHRHLPSNIHPFYDHNIGIPRPSVASHHAIMHQMQMQGNYSPHMMTDLPRAGNGSSHHGIQETGFLQENNSSFPFPAQHRIPGHLLPSTPGAGIIQRNHPPEAFQRLIELEKSAHIKQFGSGDIPWT